MKRASQGYTMIEVMTAVVVMTIGAAGILAMQGASVRSNQDANETSVAINFATTWMERVKRDARKWNTTGATDVGATDWLSQVNTTTAWVVPTTTAPESAGANFFGFDEPLTGDVRYCVNLRFTPAHMFDPATRAQGGAAFVDAIRADVVVWWHRTSSQDSARSTATCGTALTAAQMADVRVRKHFLSTVVSWRAPGWP